MGPRVNLNVSKIMAEDIRLILPEYLLCDIFVVFPFTTKYSTKSETATNMCL